MVVDRLVSEERETGVGDDAEPDLRAGAAPELSGEEEATADDLASDEDDEEEHGGDERDGEELARELFALLFASPEPLTTARIGTLIGLRGRRRVEEALAGLQEHLETTGLPLLLRSVAGGWRLFTRPEMGELVGKLAERRPERISPAALETLAIVAYRQPVTKAEIEAIRGVGSGPVLRSLVDRRLIKVTGRADQPGAPLLYGTAREFLETFGLDAVEDLPRDGELERE
jgi:segregation and condensation protein B